MNSPLLALETSGTRCSVALWHDAGLNPMLSHAFFDGPQAHAERLLPLVSDLLAGAHLGTKDLGAVAFGQGPGSFTGLRVACAIAQGIGMALAIPLIPVGTLDAVADQVPRVAAARLVVVAMDARMKEVYVCAFLLAAQRAPTNDITTSMGRPETVPDQASPCFGRSALDTQASAPQPLSAPVLLAAQDVSQWIAANLPQWRAQGVSGPLVYTGDAWEAYRDTVTIDPDWVAVDVLRPEASAVARIGLLAWQQGRGIDPADAAPLYVRDKVAFTTAERQQGAGGNPKAISSVPDAMP